MEHNIQVTVQKPKGVEVHVSVFVPLAKTAPAEQTSAIYATQSETVRA